MCSFHEEEENMDNYQGDLTDILRACTSSGEPLPSGWKVPDAVSDHGHTSFGNPFCNTRDPLLHDLHVSHASPSPSFFVPPNPIPSKEIITPTATAGTDHNNLVGPKCSNRFSHMLQISAAVDGGASGLVSGDSVINANSSSSSAGQVSSPRNPGVKRRKRQATKVVCVPAPASVNNRPSTGEIVPSDLWAWRKYGQKPIKGSPYPRGYYRCSSSKGCSARKQVERSRTDPNMLVITYTSEHNHPWPTQRNALAGSTRSHTTKSTNSAPPPKLTSTTEAKEEQKETTSINTTVSPSTVASVKEEIQDTDLSKARFDMDNDDGELGFSYKPLMPCDEDSFFAELGEIETDPDLHTLFTKGFDQDHDRPKDQTKGLEDQLGLFQW